MRLFPHRSPYLSIIIFSVLLVLIAAGCEGGLPGSSLLTPVGQVQVVSATPEPDQALTESPAPPASDTALPVTLLPETPGGNDEPGANEEPSATPSLSATLAATIEPTLAGTPTFGPSPTRTRTPSRTPFPSRTPLPSRTPTITQTPTPPLSWMRIQKPGPYSKVSSPIQVEALISPSDNGYVYVDLIGEDGRTITRQALDFRAFLNRHFYINPQIPFEINATSETARLVIRIEDRFQRPIYIISVDLVLMQLGKPELFPAVIVQEPYVMRSPRDGGTARNGVLEVRGLARPLNDQPLLFELIDEQGRLAGSASLTISQPYGDLSHVPFQVFIPYSVTGDTPARLTIRQESGTRIPGTVWLSSLLLTLQP